LLLPVRPGIDPDSVRLPLATETSSVANLSQFATNSVVVVLGNRSGGLLAIRFDGMAELEVFLDRNLESRTTLITSHGGHPIVWHRVEVAHRANLHVARLTVLMTGNMLVLDRGGLNRTDGILTSAPPSTVNLELMRWGADTTGAVDVWLTTVLAGELFRAGINGGLIPNRTVWRSYLVRRVRPQLTYEALEHRFYNRTETNDWQPVAEDAIRPWLRELVMTAPTGKATAKAAITDAWLDRLVRRLKSLLPAGPRILHARLRSFARDCLNVERGCDITVGEMYVAFSVWCRDHELQVLPELVFQQNIPVIVRADPWVRGKSKSVVRATGFQNGFRSLRLRSAVQMSPSRNNFARNGVVGVPG
jgi:hypothetical protein